MKKKHREHWKNQCRQWIRNRQSFYLGWCHRVLLDPDPSRCSNPRVKSPASCPRNISSVGLSQPWCAGGLRSHTGASINTKPKNFSSVKSVTQGPCWRQVVSDLHSLDQIEMKNRRRQSFHTEPTLIFFGGLFSRLMFFKLFRFQCQIAATESNLVHTEKGLQFPPVAHMCTFMLVYAKRVFQKFKTFQLRRKTNHLFNTVFKKQRQESVAAHRFGRLSGDRREEQRRVRSWAKRMRNQHTSWALPICCVSFKFSTQSLLPGAGRYVWPLVPLVTPQNVLAMLFSEFGCLLYTT